MPESAAAPPPRLLLEVERTPPCPRASAFHVSQAWVAPCLDLTPTPKSRGGQQISPLRLLSQGRKAGFGGSS